MSGIRATSLRLTGTKLAQYFRFRCDRQLRWELVPRDARGDDVPPGERAAGTRLLYAAGIRWERKVVERLARVAGERAVVRPATGDQLAYQRVVDVLRDPGGVRWLVQATLRVPPSFYARFGIDPALVDLADATPDLIRIRRTKSGRVRVGVGDVKWAREGGLQHFAQIAFYALVLEEVCRAEGIDAVVDRRRGWIWTRGSRKPRPFPLPAYRHHVEAFLREDLPRIAASGTDEADWHLGPACASCAFFRHCTGEAEAVDHLARVPDLTPTARQVLRERGIGSVAELRRMGMRRDTYTGAHALEAGERRLKQRVMALELGRVFPVHDQTYRMGPAESVRIVLSADDDPVSGTCFALGLRVEREGTARAEQRVFLSASGSLDSEREMLGAFLGRLGEVLAEAVPERGAVGTKEKPVHFYVYDRAELERFRGMLQRHLASPDALPGIAALAGFLYPAAERARARTAAPPGTVVADAVAELFALPVPYAYDLRSVSAALRPDERPAVFEPAEGYGVPLSSQVSFERAHRAWASSRRNRPEAEEIRAEIERTVERKLAAIASVLRAVRERAERGRPRLLMDPAAPPYFGAPRRLNTPSLERLRVFTELEAFEESLAVRALHTLPTEDRVRRFESIRGLEPQERVSDREWWFTFDPACREAKFREGDFALVLTNDDGETLVETDRKLWLRRKLGVELVRYDLSGDRPRVLLSSEYGFKRLEEEKVLSFRHLCVLDRAEADFNTRRVLATLRHLDEGRGESPFILDLLNGAVSPDWLLAPLSGDVGWRGTIGRVESVGHAVLNREQEQAWWAAFERAVTVVWGPPGTGKTYLLAWTLLGLAASARAEGRSLRVLVTAVTHRAIVNVLARLAREVESAGIPSPLSALKLVGRGSGADEELEGLDVELLEDEKLEARLKEADEAKMPIVVGATVWSLWKRMRDANLGEGDEAGDVPIHPTFDVVVIDEASQMKVAESLVALSSIRRGGRVILAGDDRQLAPIVRGRYPDEPLFGSAFSYFSAHFRRIALLESRRMSEPLTVYPRRLFYPGFHAADENRRRSIHLAQDVDLSDPLDALLWDAFLRPDQAAVLCTYTGYPATARNAFEARLVARLAALARRALADPATGEAYTAERFRTHAFAALSPHRAQNSAILAELRAMGWAYGELPVVDTVERMQGNEREVIAVSYAVADREYAEREAEFLLNPNRFNVSTTRARSKLVVFMSEEVLRALPKDERVMGDSMAVKGYPAHFGGRVREIDLPAPDGATVRAALRWR